jgi:transcriptional regulator with XRE-family HTH domain
MNIPIITVGTRLALARKKAGISGEEMARRLGVTTRTISRYENSVTDVPRMALLAYQVICDVPIEFIEGRMDLTQEVASIRCSDQRPLFELRPTG